MSAHRAANINRDTDRGALREIPSQCPYLVIPSRAFESLRKPFVIRHRSWVIEPGGSSALDFHARQIGVCAILDRQYVLPAMMRARTRRTRTISLLKPYGEIGVRSAPSTALDGEIGLDGRVLSVALPNVLPLEADQCGGASDGVQAKGR